MGKLKLEPQKFCEAFYDWAKACQTELPTDDANTKIWRQEFRSHWQFVEIAIQKSCLLYRLIYAGESLRAKMCRVHRGKWSGCVPEKLPCGCQFGSNVTGWLRENGMKNLRMKPGSRIRGKEGPRR